MNFRILKFGSLILPQANPTIQLSYGPVPAPSQPMSAGGAYDLAGLGQTYRQGGTLRYTALVRGSTDTDLENKLNDLSTYLGRRDSLTRRMLGSGQEHTVTARLVDIGGARRAGDRLAVFVDLTFQVYNRVWNGLAHTDTTVLPGPGPFSAFPENNGGNVPVYAIRLDYTPTADRATTDVRLYTVSYGVSVYFHWHFTDTVVGGTTLIIDNGTKRVTNNGVDAYSAFVLQSDHTSAEWLGFVPGANSPEFNMAASDTVVVTFYDAWN